jgi:hypothetical protein
MVMREEAVYSSAVASCLGCSWANIVFFLETVCTLGISVCLERKSRMNVLTITSWGNVDNIYSETVIFLPQRDSCTHLSLSKEMSKSSSTFELSIDFHGSNLINDDAKTRVLLSPANRQNSASNRVSSLADEIGGQHPEREHNTNGGRVTPPGNYLT